MDCWRWEWKRHRRTESVEWFSGVGVWEQFSKHLDEDVCRLDVGRSALNEQVGGGDETNEEMHTGAETSEGSDGANVHPNRPDYDIGTEFDIKILFRIDKEMERTSFLKVI